MLGESTQCCEIRVADRALRKLRRYTGRLRWALKSQLVLHYNFPVLKRPLTAVNYVLWDPEVESYSYQVGNEPELAQTLAPILGVSADQVIAWFNEAKSDPYLSRDRGWSWDRKRRLSLGNRLMYYPVVRALKPRVIVEAGIHEGQASEMFLCALRRNAAEGSPGRLISFDIHNDTGGLVHPDLRADWQRVIDSTLTGMDPVLRGVEVDLFLHDTFHNHDVIAGELDVILRHAGPRLAVIDASGLMRTTLRDYCQRLGTNHHFVRDQPSDHVVKSHGMGLAIFDRPGATVTRKASLNIGAITKATAGLCLLSMETALDWLNISLAGLYAGRLPEISLALNDYRRIIVTGWKRATGSAGRV